MKITMDLFDNICPKVSLLDKVTKKQVIEIQTRLNQRPRKRLKYKTPEEVYDKMKTASRNRRGALMAKIRVFIYLL